MHTSFFYTVMPLIFLSRLLALTEHPARLVEGGIVGIEVFAIHLILRDAQGISETAVSNRCLDFPERLFLSYHIRRETVKIFGENFILVYISNSCHRRSS